MVIDQDICNMYMTIALQEATRSNDPSTQNGAVVVDEDYEDFSWAFNKFPTGVRDTTVRWERPLKYRFIEHAERGAIYSAAKKGLKTNHGTMYCPWAACSDCARGIVEAGITTLVRFPKGPSYLSHWDEEVGIGDEILNEGGVSIIENSFTTLTLPSIRRNGDIWNGA